jgi:hypothetical protein
VPWLCQHLTPQHFIFQQPYAHLLIYFTFQTITFQAHGFGFSMMDPSALEKKMLEAAIAASLQDFQKQARQSSSQSSSQTQDQSHATQSGSKTPSKSSSQAANPQMMPDQPRRSPQLPQPLKSQVVDLTNDSSSDSDLQEIFPKSKSVIGSDTDA